MQINDFTIIILISGVIHLLLGIFTNVMSRSRAAFVFLWTTIFVSAWTVVIAFFVSTSSPDGATFLVKSAYFMGYLTGTTFLFFAYRYPNNDAGGRFLKLIFIIATPICAYLMYATDSIIAQSFYIGGIARWGWQFGFLWYIFPLIFYVPYLSGIAVLFYKGLKLPDLGARRSCFLMAWSVLILISGPTIVNVILPQVGVFSYIWMGPILTLGWIVAIAYSIVRYEAFDIRLIAKRAFAYGLIVAGLGLASVSTNLLNTFLLRMYPNFPSWSLYFFSAVLTAAIGYFVWLKVRENDLLKYEFINIISHKILTPLTEIRWSEEEIEKNSADEKVLQSARTIKSANFRMLTLLDSLTTLSDSEGTYVYSPHDFSFADLVEEHTKRLAHDFKKNNKDLRVSIESKDFINADRQKIGFIVQTLLGNALVYTPSGGTVAVKLLKAGAYLALTVADTGIGISEKDRPYVFTKFFRAGNARTTDTEGLGIGLFLSSLIARRSGGSIGVSSSGENQGAVFTLKLPISAKVSIKNGRG